MDTICLDNIAGRDPVLAIDIGGTKIDIGVVNADREIEHRIRIDNASVEGRLSQALLEAVASIGAERYSAVGVGTAGPFVGPQYRVSPANLREWRDFPLGELLESAQPHNVNVINDVQALALAEGCFGVAADSSDFLAMVVSTGVGGGIVSDRRLVRGNTGNAGHIGHIVIDPSGPICGCGRRGCLEAVISGSALATRGIDPRQLDQSHQRELGSVLGTALISAGAMLDFERVVIGGSVALGFGQPFFEAVQRALNDGPGFDFARNAVVSPAQLGAQAPLIGAACAAWSMH